MFDQALERLNDLSTGLAVLLPRLLVGLVMFLVGLLIARGVRAGVQPALAVRESSTEVASVVGRIGGGVAVLVPFLVAASVAFPSISTDDLFNLLGIGGVAIGFAFRVVPQNLLASILLLLTRRFHIGDQIRLGGQEGTVEDIWVRATVLRTYDNRRIFDRQRLVLRQRYRGHHRLGEAPSLLPEIGWTSARSSPELPLQADPASALRPPNRRAPMALGH